MLRLDTKLSDINGIGPVRAKHLARLGCFTAEDLLQHVPSRYEDFSTFSSIKNLQPGNQATIRGKIQAVSTRRSFKKRLTITEALISDGTGTVKAIWFNQPYLKQNLKLGSEVLMAGKLSASRYGWQLEHPIYEPAERAGLNTGRLVPIYSLSGSITQKLIRNFIRHLLPLTNEVADWLPAEVQKKFNLLSLGSALKELHAPTNPKILANARTRLAFGELFLIHAQTSLSEEAWREGQAPRIPFHPSTKDFVSYLPWQLTPDQKIAAWKIIQDLSSDKPMCRLLQGDVGSGKTIVAGLAAYNASLAGWQTALLSPTEVLANQHFKSLSQLFERTNIQVGLLTRSQREMAHKSKVKLLDIQQDLEQSKIDILIGTHALLQPEIRFNKLGLLIIDEQHRFGVEQRQALLLGRPTTPHLLSLSATPIPRSLALTIYGNLELSVIKTLPSGRKPITTRMLSAKERDVAYELIKQEIADGHRAFIIYPLIEESETQNVRAAENEHERLSQEVFPSITLGLLHGRLPAKEKNEIMEKFRRGETPILISTSVIEVGVDVPEATVIMIENAERFGVAQLHQFRGRVGRSPRPSYCFLVSENTNSPTIQALIKYQSGFDLAEFDLSHRGPGNLLGELQSGWAGLKYSALATPQLIAQSQQAVHMLRNIDHTLSRWPKLLIKIRNLSHPE